MTLVRSDPARCQGYANCVVASPDVFDLADSGVVTILVEDVDATQLRQVHDAVRSCPVSAIWTEPV